MRALTRQLPALVAVAAIAAASAACSSSSASPTPSGSATAQGGPAAAGFPVTVTTAGGRTHLASRPGAIVSLSPTATEMLYAIGAGSQVKAVDSDSDYPKQAPITKLSAYSPNAEAIAAYKPDLVIISNDIGGITAKLTALSIPVLDLPAAASVADVYAEFTELGEATGHLAQAKTEDSTLKSDIGKIVASMPAHAKPLTYYYELSTNPYYSVTSSTFIGSLLSLLGMKSIADAAKGAAAAGGYPTLDAEYILKANPDYIILSDTGSTGGGQDAATVSARPGWSVLTAVKDKHIIVLNADIASRWGPRIVNLLQTVAAGVKSGAT
ncbi:MAG TPA: ABC transporter substrate-binding protein [Streptosporangiaceae bacterium]|nr:ABC transporter substrate-binding protein [Streptosporangiaceae bacterium]